MPILNNIYTYHSFTLCHPHYLHLEIWNLWIFILILDHQLIVTWVFMFDEVITHPFISCYDFLTPVVNIIDSWFLCHSILIREGSKDWIISKRTNIPKRIIVFGLKVKVGLSHSILTNIPDEIVVDYSIFVLEA